MPKKRFEDYELGRGKDLTGLKFGKLTVVSFAGRIKSGKKGFKFLWNCVCECGGKRITTSTQLINKKLKHAEHSCGCASFIHRLREDRERVIIGYLFSICRSQAIKRGIKFTLTLEEYKEKILKPCHYCGEPYSIEQADHAHKNGEIIIYSDTVVKCNGLDRVKNNKGYTFENVEPCCLFCNISKNNYTEEYFIKKIKQIYHHLNLENK